MRRNVKFPFKEYKLIVTYLGFIIANKIIK